MKSSVSAELGVRSDTNILSGDSISGEAERLDLAQKKSLQIWLWMGLVLPLLSMVPLLYEQANSLIANRSHLFFPLSTLIGAWLLYRTCVQRPTGIHRGRIAVGLIWIGMGLAILGIYFFSPWIVHVASVIVVFGWSLGAFGRSSWTRIAAICSLFAVSVPLPSGLDVQFNGRLQSIASWATNGFLDAISVPNIIEGNILQIQDKKISIPIVCGGAESVFALMAIGLAIVVSRRCSLLVSLLTILSVPLCSVLGNVFRLIAIAIGFEYLDTDLSTGSGYIATSLVVFAISVACVLLLHISAQAIFDPILERAGTNNLTKFYQWVAAWPQTEQSLSDPNPWRARFVFLMVPSLACFIFGSLSAYAIFSSEKAKTSSIAMNEEQAASLPSQSAFPVQFGSLRMTGYNPTTQSAADRITRYSHQWKFDDSGNQIFVTLDFPFDGWRPVSAGYQSSGWKIIDTKPVVIPPERGGEAWTAEEFSMQNQYGLFGFVWYAFFDNNGVPIKRANDKVGSSRINLLARLQKSPSVQLPLSFQVQLFLESGRELNESELASNRQLFFEVFERLRQQSEVVLKKAN